MSQFNEKGSDILPEDFDGVFKFTNWTNEDFTGRWNKVDYTFPANRTSPMIMNFSPVEIQSIRKKFARDLAIREWYKSEKFKAMNAHVPGGTPATYTDSDIMEFTQKCLKPLEISLAKAKVIKTKPIEEINRRDEDGELLTTVLDQKKSLIKDGATVLKD